MQHVRLNKRGKGKVFQGDTVHQRRQNVSTIPTFVVPSRQSALTILFPQLGLANRPGIEVQIDDHSDISFALAADSCMNRVRLRRVKIARKGGEIMLHLHCRRNPLEELVLSSPHSRLKVRGISCHVLMSQTICRNRKASRERASRRCKNRECCNLQRQQQPMAT